MDYYTRHACWVIERPANKIRLLVFEDNLFSEMRTVCDRMGFVIGHPTKDCDWRIVRRLPKRNVKNRCPHCDLFASGIVIGNQTELASAEIEQQTAAQDQLLRAAVQRQDTAYQTRLARLRAEYDRRVERYVEEHKGKQQSLPALYSGILEEDRDRDPVP